jgi:hypothetical protein
MSFTLATYDHITSDLNNILSRGSSPIISLFSDQEGNILFTDTNGRTHNEKTIISINYTQPHNAQDGTQLVNGYLTLTFSDGTSAVITDNVDIVYYSTVAINFNPRPLNQ